MVEGYSNRSSQAAREDVMGKVVSLCRCGCGLECPPSKMHGKIRVFFDNQHLNRYHNRLNPYRNRKRVHEKRDSFACEPQQRATKGMKKYPVKCPQCEKIREEFFQSKPLVMPRIRCPNCIMYRSASPVYQDEIYCVW